MLNIFLAIINSNRVDIIIGEFSFSFLFCVSYQQHEMAW